MKKITTALLLGSILLSSCMKEEFYDAANPPQQIVKSLPCIEQTDNPAGRSYDVDSLVDYSCTDKHCGMMPLSTGSYWVYQDSVFNNGVFVQVKFDTLRYASSIKSLSDGLTWWESDLFVGLPKVLYNNDSSIFAMRPKLFNPELQDVKRDLFLFQGDSARYLASFDDIAASGRSLRMNGRFTVPAGEFDNYIYFEKNARNYRKDQVFFKPGVGVLKYIHEMAPFGEREIKLQQVMTLVAFHIE